MENKVIERTVKISVSPDAQTILAQTKYTIDDLIRWKLKTPQPIGSSDVMFFLVAMGKEAERNGTTSR